MRKVVIPYKHCYGAIELKYCLRGIEKYVDDAEVIVIGDLPKGVHNITHIPFKDRPEYKWKERNIYEKIMLVNDDFLFFNDDHFLLEPFNYEYHYSGTLEDQIKEYSKNPFAQVLRNTKEVFGNIKNYYRHQPILMKNHVFKKINVDWNKEWGYCVKSIYCHLAGVEGKEYPDLKIRRPTTEKNIREQIKGRQYFSTEDGALNIDMIRVLESVYPNKSKHDSTALYNSL